MFMKAAGNSVRRRDKITYRRKIAKEKSKPLREKREGS